MESPTQTQNNFLSQMLSTIDPIEQARTVSRMALSVRISEGLEKKGWTKSKFASKMKKRPSEISKWLSGTHNFTADTLTDIEGVLGINLLCQHRPGPTSISLPVQVRHVTGLVLESYTDEYSLHDNIINYSSCISALDAYNGVPVLLTDN